MHILEEKILAARKAGRTALIPFVTAGFPSRERFWDVVRELDASGADIIEIGVPFSDPVADGPVVEAASIRALESGVTLGGMGAVGWVNLLIVGLIHTGITYCMYFSSLKELPGQKAAILSYIDPLVAILISVTVLGEPMTLWQAAGGILILGFTLWNELPVGKKG